MFEDEIFGFELEAREYDMFYPWAENYVTLTIHSPFIPPDLFYDGITLQEGYVYVVSVSLEEEHLQPAPYPTNCTDYVALWGKTIRQDPAHKKSMPAEKCVEVFKSKLAKHGLSLKEDIVSITTDGATAMNKIGKLIGANQQLCHAHGIQLGSFRGSDCDPHVHIYPRRDAPPRFCLTVKWLVEV
ncbi:uncharacterized protein CDAR_235421 [Caerostris darwini]|uniref:DUF4371 domain-containing protein n=1 Tax=Caerostris darwini TaxID=1538125 RepID=A0AAV4NA25_9ARAC|nr:uncharacterized protein CDAR_235421 [Caerostris darwini]